MKSRIPGPLSENRTPGNRLGLELIGVCIAKNVYLHFHVETRECRDKFAHHESMPQAREVRIAMRTGDQEAWHAIQRGVGLSPREW